MGRAERITRAVRSYDPKLYCESSEDGKLCIFRKSSRIESYEVDGMKIDFVRPAPHFVFALTDNWRMVGRPVEWGILPILARIKAVDLWQRDLAGECLLQTEKNTEANFRAARNSTEGFLHEFRSQFKKTFNDVNTASMKKIDRRRKDEKNGNY